MKRLFFFILILISVDSFAQTGTGWTQVRAKMNFKDSVNIANGWKIGGTVVLPSVTEINYVDGVTSAIQGQINGKLPITDTTAMLSHYPKKRSFTQTLSAGAQTNVTLTGVTTEPYSILIFDSDGLNITVAGLVGSAELSLPVLLT